jgi:hypothetical protein
MLSYTEDALTSSGGHWSGASKEGFSRVFDMVRRKRILESSNNHKNNLPI